MAKPDNHEPKHPVPAAHTTSAPPPPPAPEEVVTTQEEQLRRSEEDGPFLKSRTEDPSPAPKAVPGVSITEKKG
jgi:hypothetical protein